LDLSGNRILRLPGLSLSGLRSLALINVSLNRLSLLDTFPKVKPATRAVEKKEMRRRRRKGNGVKKEGILKLKKENSSVFCYLQNKYVLYLCY
jgi:hypothetical protein